MNPNRNIYLAVRTMMLTQIKIFHIISEVEKDKSDNDLIKYTLNKVNKFSFQRLRHLSYTNDKFKSRYHDKYYTYYFFHLNYRLAEEKVSNNLLLTFRLKNYYDRVLLYINKNEYIKPQYYFFVDEIALS